jgi:methylenetetrahydrofolate dehydrogenase (NADP+) / methenyltetrahydrofolate cyclohydrolase
MKILDGKKLAADIKTRLKQEVKQMPSPPGLAAILVGDNEASKAYINIKEKACKEVGILFYKHIFPVNTPAEELVEIIAGLNNDPNTHGILVQLPLPASLDTHTIIQTINPKKDADGFHQENFRLLRANRPRVISPPLASVLKLLEATGEKLNTKTAVILANSQEFAKPLQVLLANHSIKSLSLIKTPEFKQVSQKADILITALGEPHKIKAEHIKKDAILIDVGFTRKAGKIKGDIDPASIKDKASFISPVPGGVGPLTVAYLLKNVVKLARH